MVRSRRKRKKASKIPQWFQNCAKVGGQEMCRVQGRVGFGS
jgi:hypothetical protein